MRTWRVAVVGLGEAGRAIHLPALRGLPGVELVATCDPDPARRAAAADAGAPSFESLPETLERSRPQVVVIATPPALHADHAVTCLEAGAHVVLEKPVAARLAEVDRIAAAARAAGRMVVPNHPFRMAAPFAALLSAAAAEGPVRFARAWQMVDLPRPDETGWRGRIESRTLYEAGVHLVDLLVALFGGAPAAVTAAFGPGGPAGDRVAATLEFPGGGLAQLTQSRSHPGRARYLELAADTDTASFRASHGGRARVVAGLEGRRPTARLEIGGSGLAWREAGGRRRTLGRGSGDPRVAGTRALIAGALEAAAARADPPVRLAEARAGLAVIAACHRSAELGRRVTPDEPELAEMDLARER